MGISCTSGAGNRIQFSVTSTTSPWTISFWFRVYSDTAFINIFGFPGIDVSAGGSIGGDPLNVQDGSLNTWDTTNGFTKDIWQHCTLSRSGGGTASLYINGGGKVSGALDAPGSATAIFGSSAANVDIAEIAMWGVQLTDAEVAILALGASPVLVRPASVLHYLPLIRAVQDRARSTSITSDGAGVTDHPRVFHKRNRKVFFAAPPNEVTASALSNLALSQSAALSELERTALNAIVFSYSTYPPFVEVGAANTLALTQSREYNNNVQNALALTQQAYSPEVLRTIEQTLRLRHTLRAVTGNLASGRYRR